MKLRLTTLKEYNEITLQLSNVIIPSRAVHPVIYTYIVIYTPDTTCTYINVPPN